MSKTALQLGHLYQVEGETHANREVYVAPHIYINTGTVNVYGSDSDTRPTSVTDMVMTNSTAVGGFRVFATVPNYIVITQHSGTTTELLAVGLVVKDLGNV